MGFQGLLQRLFLTWSSNSHLPVSPAGFSLSWAPRRALWGWGIGVAVGLKAGCEGVFTAHLAEACASRWWASAGWRQTVAPIWRSSVWAGALRVQTRRQQGAEGTCQAIWCFSGWGPQSPAFMDRAPRMSWAFRLGCPGWPQRGMWQWQRGAGARPLPWAGASPRSSGWAGRERSSSLGIEASSLLMTKLPSSFSALWAF